MATTTRTKTIAKPTRKARAAATGKRLLRQVAKPSVRQSLVDILKATPSRKNQNWFDRMAEGKDKQQLREIKAAYRANEFGNRGYKWLHDNVQQHIDLPCGLEAFGDWLKRGDS